MKISKRRLKQIIREEYARINQKSLINESAGFSVYSERGKYIESSDGDLLQLAGPEEPKIIVSSGRERGSLSLSYDGSIYLDTNRRDQNFNSLQELCDYLNANGFEYIGIDDY